MNQKNPKPDKERLSKEVFDVCILGGTEKPFSGKYNDFFDEGVYQCAVCHEPLFSSDSKFSSKSGWPSFFQPIKEDKIEYVPDKSHGMERIEVKCQKCGAHLGHVFEDGPEPTHKRYCINSVALMFIKGETK